jgi:hypothetical protein
METKSMMMVQMTTFVMKASSIFLTYTEPLFAILNMPCSSVHRIQLFEITFGSQTKL